MTGIYTALVSKVLFPLHERLKKHDTVAIKSQLEQSQWLTKDKILSAQNQRLREFLIKAERDVPYYKALFF
jgi:phenylacetate-CoA ligase